MTDQAAILETVAHLLSLCGSVPERPPLADKGWFTMKEAMAWTGLSRKYLSEKMAEGRLWYQRFGGRGDIRIPKAHLDEQMARSFPLLDVPLTLADLERMPPRPLTRLIPGPKIERDPNKPYTRLK